MASTELSRGQRVPQRPDDRRDDRYDDGRADRGVKMITTTETRRSFMTTEFWLTLMGAVIVVIAGYWDNGNLRVGLAWPLAVGLVAVYVLSRGIAKAGSHDPQIRDLS
jgi:hypothetical protein